MNQTKQDWKSPTKASIHALKYNSKKLSNAIQLDRAECLFCITNRLHSHLCNSADQPAPAFYPRSHSNLGGKKKLCSPTTHQETHLISPACPASPWRVRAPWTWGCQAGSTQSRHQRSPRGSAWAARAHTCGRRCADMAGWAGGWRAPCRWGRSAPSRCSWSAPVHRQEKNK